MKQKTRLVALLLLTAVVVLTVFAQPVRKDAVWARSVPAGTITLDGILNEAAWAKAESVVVQWNGTLADPGSGYMKEAGAMPTDSTYAILKFLVSSANKLYVGIKANDKSVGGGLFNKFDGFLMNIRHKQATGFQGTPGRDWNTDANFEYFYGWVTEGWADTSLGQPTALPGFFGWAGGKRTDSTDGVRNSDIWNAVTKVIGTQNDDSKLDTAWVTELEFTLTPRFYNVTKVGGDIVPFNISIYDADWQWPLDTLKFSGTRTWLQGPWGNASAYSHLRIFADPTVTTTTTTLPAIPYDLTVYHAQNNVVPVIDGNLNDPLWKHVPSFKMKYGDNAVRNAYKNTMPYRSGQFQPDVWGKKDNVLDPAEADVKLAFKADTLYVGIAVKDKFVQYRPEFDRQDGFKLLLKDRTLRDATEHILKSYELYARIDTSATKYWLEGYAPTLVSDTLGAANNGSRIVLKLNSGTTVDTLGAAADSGYSIEMKINLRALGYPAGRGDGAFWFGALLNDGDTFGAQSGVPASAYGNRVWYGHQGTWNDGPGFAYLDPTAVLTSVESNSNNVPGTFEVHGSYPNPFNPSTTIEFSLPKQANVKIVVFDVLGRAVSNRTMFGLGIGRQGYRFDASGLSSGTYFYQVQMLDIATGDVLGVHSGKMMLLK